MDSTNPMDVLKEEMENEEVSMRVNAIHRLRIVATLIGTDKIKSQLVPYIDTLIKKEEDEVLFALADEIGMLSTLVPNQPLLLISQLELLAGFDETVVREKAIQSIITVCSLISDQEIQSQIIPMLFRLANNEANFTCRVSAVNLMCPLYTRSGNQKEKIRQKFTELCNEETPMVRRVVAIKIGEIAQFMDKSNVLNDLIPIQKQLCQDEQDQVRLLCMESLKNMAKILSVNENKNNTLPLIIQAAEDKSWRVRLALSKIFAEMAEAMGREISDSSLIQIFSNLLKDCESDVRVVAVNSLAKFIKQVSVEKLQLIIPILQQLSRDSQANVKCAVTLVYSSIAPLLPKEQSQQKLSSYLLEMLSDENYEVRKGAAQAVGKFAEVMGPEGLQLFGPALKTSMEDGKWRVRKEVLTTIADLALKIKSQDLFVKYLEPIFMLYLKDRAWEVRQLGNLKLPSLAAILKPEWVANSLVPRIQELLIKDNGAAFRINAIYAIQQISSVAAPEVLADKLLPITIKNLKDPVPNVRFVALKVLKSFTKRVDVPQIQNQVKQLLQEMQEDSDRDVKFFATEALTS